MRNSKFKPYISQTARTEYVQSKSSYHDDEFVLNLADGEKDDLIEKALDASPENSKSEKDFDVKKRNEKLDLDKLLR